MLNNQMVFLLLFPAIWTPLLGSQFLRQKRNSVFKTVKTMAGRRPHLKNGWCQQLCTGLSREIGKDPFSLLWVASSFCSGHWWPAGSWWVPSQFQWRNIPQSTEGFHGWLSWVLPTAQKRTWRIPYIPDVMSEIAQLNAPNRSSIPRIWT